MAIRSKRFDQIPPYLFAEISRKKAEAIAKGMDLIDLGIGDPDLPTPLPIIESLQQAAENSMTHRYDETPRGWKPFLEAASDWAECEFSLNIDPEKEICQLIGSKEGLAHLAWAYIDEGDVAICPNPGYTVYKVNTLMAGGEVYETPLLEKNGFLPELEKIPSDIARRAKLFYVCYPHNPTGAVANQKFYAKLVEFCRSYDILLVCDMAYATVTYNGFKNPSVLQIPGAKDVAIEFHSLSKMFNMTGWRLGFALGNAYAISTLQELKSNIDSKQFPAIAEAGATALREVSNQPTFELYEKRRDVFCEGLCSIGWQVRKPDATFYIWAKVPQSGMTSAEFASDLLEKAQVFVIPGSGYGKHGEGYIRMSLTLQGDREGERFKEAVDRIQRSGLIP